MSELEECNGWTNRPTWLVHLWLTNDETIYRVASDTAAQGAKALESFVSELVDPEGGSMGSDLLQWALSFVNWPEIVEALVPEPLE